METNLIEPNDKYVRRILNSWHYLNCPKHMLNHDLDCLYRQGIVENKSRAIEYISNYLKSYSIPKPIITATKFVEWRDSINIKTFNLLNVNKFMDELPQHVQALDNKINTWIKDNTEYYHGMFGGGVKYVPTYIF